MKTFHPVRWGLTLWVATTFATTLLILTVANAQSNSSRGFTCLKVGNERGGIYSLVSNTGVTMLSPLEYDACLSAIRELNQGRSTCIRVSRGVEPQYALASVERIISSPLEYDTCLQAASDLNQQKLFQ